MFSYLIRKYTSENTFTIFIESIFPYSLTQYYSFTCSYIIIVLVQNQTIYRFNGKCLLLNVECNYLLMLTEIIHTEKWFNESYICSINP